MKLLDSINRLWSGVKILPYFDERVFFRIMTFYAKPKQHNRLMILLIIVVSNKLLKHLNFISALKSAKLTVDI